MRLHLDKEDLFWVGNVVGVVALVLAFVILGPKKERERREHEQLLARQKQEQQVAARNALRNGIVCAAHDLKPGDQISATDLILVEVVATKVKRQTYTSTAALVGRVARIDIRKGEPVLESQLEATDRTQEKDEH
jgi:Flp pilus assembly protein CpaB